MASFSSTANDSIHGPELWRSNGTLLGTASLAPTGDSDPLDFFALGSTTFFSANDGIHGLELWRTDGTASGTVMVKDINPGPGDSIYSKVYFQNLNGTLFFSATDGTHGYELWRGHGRRPAPSWSRISAPAASGSDPRDLTVFDGTLFFNANDGARTGAMGEQRDSRRHHARRTTSSPAPTALIPTS